MTIPNPTFHMGDGDENSGLHTCTDFLPSTGSKFDFHHVIMASHFCKIYLTNKYVYKIGNPTSEKVNSDLCDPCRRVNALFRNDDVIKLYKQVLRFS